MSFGINLGLDVIQRKKRLSVIKMMWMMIHEIFIYKTKSRERSGSVVECLTRDRRAAGSSLTGVTALWSLSKTHFS